MFCSNCGNQLPDGAQFCGRCAAPQNASAAQKQQQSYYPPPYAQQGYYQQTPPPEPDVPNTGLNVASFFFPIVGFIIYATSHTQTPIKAKAALKMAIISTVLTVVFILLMSALAFVPMMMYL